MSLGKSLNEKRLTLRSSRRQHHGLEASRRAVAGSLHLQCRSPEKTHHSALIALWEYTSSPHLELVKAQHVRLGGEVARDGRDGVASCVSKLRLHGVHAFVHVDHEGVEVYAALAGDVRGKRVVEEVHEHGLAGADISVEVETFRQPFWWGGGPFRWLAKETRELEDEVVVDIGSARKRLFGRTRDDDGGECETWGGW